MKIRMHDEARQGLVNGINTLADAVAVTMGPKGRNVTIDIKNDGNPQVTKDGVTVAESIVLEDNHENTGASMVKQVAKKTGDIAGDGTTTATVLARSLIVGGMKHLAAGADPIDIKRGIDKAVKDVLAALAHQSYSVKIGSQELENVATISSNNDPEMGKLIAGAFAKVGDAGVVTVEKSPNGRCYDKVVKGMQFDRGYLSPLFPTNPEGTICELENPMYMLVDGKMTSADDMMPVLELAVQVGRPIVIIADDVSDGALGTMLVNCHKNVKCVAIKAPGFTDTRFDLLTDISVITKSVVFSDKTGFDVKNITEEILGGSGSITVERGSTVIVDGIGDQEMVNNRINKLKSDLDKAESPKHEKDLLNRIAKMSGGVGVVYIGAATTAEQGEMMDRADDALCATRAAIEEGIVAGGGSALAHSVPAITDVLGAEQVGVNLVKTAITEPLKRIAENSGANGDVVLQAVKSLPSSGGYNAKTGEYVEMIPEGIIDPLKVTRVALQNAASIAGMVLLTECSINYKN